MKQKLKTNKSAAKRFKKLGSGKIKRKSSKMRHNLRKLTKDTKRSLRKTGYVDDNDKKLVDRLMPY